MKFPSSADKGLQYESCAYILADVIGNMGFELTDVTMQRWGNMMYRLAAADELAETQPEAFSSGEHLVEVLQIVNNEMAVEAASGLLAASSRSINSSSIREHLDNRRDEAVESVALLRSQTPELIDESDLWSEVDTMTIAGIYLDSFVDAREDAGERADFTPGNLALHSFARFVKTVREMRMDTRIAVAQAGISHGLAGYIFRSAPSKLLTT
jgi:hypothetical protein